MRCEERSREGRGPWNCREEKTYISNAFLVFTQTCSTSDLLTELVSFAPCSISLLALVGSRTRGQANHFLLWPRGQEDRELAKHSWLIISLLGRKKGSRHQDVS